MTNNTRDRMISFTVEYEKKKEIMTTARHRDMTVSDLMRMITDNYLAGDSVESALAALTSQDTPITEMGKKLAECKTEQEKLALFKDYIHKPMDTLIAVIEGKETNSLKIGIAKWLWERAYPKGGEFAEVDKKRGGVTIKWDGDRELKL